MYTDDSLIISSKDEYYSKLRHIFSTIPRQNESERTSQDAPILATVRLKQDLDSAEFNDAHKRLRGLCAHMDAKSTYMSSFDNTMDEKSHESEVNEVEFAQRMINT